MFFMNMTIEYENQDLLIVNKPAGIPVYSTKKSVHEDSVLTWFLEKYPEAKAVGDPERPGIVHRLDKQTSGLLCLAKTAPGYEFLTKLFRSREINKEYLSLVYGRVEKHGIIDKPLSKIGHEGQSRVRVNEAGKEAKTEYWAEKYYGLGVDEFTLVRVKLHTGRTHQIRVHMASEKHPVMGDDLYGKPQSQKLFDILKRQFLHANRLEFKLPDGTWLEIESKFPEDLQEVLNKLKFQSSNDKSNPND